MRLKDLTNIPAPTMSTTVTVSVIKTTEEEKKQRRKRILEAIIDNG